VETVQNVYTVTFEVEGGSNKQVAAAFGASVMDVAREAGILLDAPCAGAGTCGKCRVRVVEGSIDGGRNWRKAAEEYEAGWRLACQATIHGDVTLMVPAEAGSFAHDIETAGLSTQKERDRFQTQIDELIAVGLERGVEAATNYGVAIDIGTTTVSAVLLDMATGQILGRESAGNDQIRYGADVINRIVNQGKPGGVQHLQDAILKNTLVPLINQMAKQAGVSAEEISRVVIAGNTTMEHLLLGEDGSTIRLEPYVPAFLEREGDTGQSVGLPVLAQAPVIFAPNVGSYVGGDITAGVLATRMWLSDLTTLFIDLGTNGEMVYGNQDFLLCCACSAGPAFEGGDISCGMRATTGAIQACTIDPETMDPTFDVVGGGAVVGLCGSGLIDAVAELFRAGIINAKGKMVREGKRVRARDMFGKEFVLAFEGEHGATQDIALNETDIDNFIRAKGSIYSAYRTMLAAVGTEESDLDRVIIAGGIGSGINIENAISLGMLPNLPREMFTYIGNSSLTGASAMLISAQAEEKVFELGRSMTYLELSMEPGYMEEFIAACFIPHTNASLFI